MRNRIDVAPTVRVEVGTLRLGADPGWSGREVLALFESSAQEREGATVLVPSRGLLAEDDVRQRRNGHRDRAVFAGREAVGAAGEVRVALRAVGLEDEVEITEPGREGPRDRPADRRRRPTAARPVRSRPTARR